MSNIRAYFAGGGVGSLAGAVFLIRDAQIPGPQITIYEDFPVAGGSCDGQGDSRDGYVIRGGRMLNLPTYECTWALLKDIPSLTSPGKSVYEDIVEFNRQNKTEAKARLVDRYRFRRPVTNMGFSFRDRVDLLKLTRATEVSLGSSKILDHFRAEFFQTNFWLMWSTTFAFQPWHSAVELKRYMVRFMHEFSRIQTLEGVARTPYNQYDSIILPLQKWLEAQGVNFVFGARVIDVDAVKESDLFRVLSLQVKKDKVVEKVLLGPNDVVFIQNGSMTGASSLGGMSKAPRPLDKFQDPSFLLWEKITDFAVDFGRPGAFSGRIPESAWESFTVTLRDPVFFKKMVEFSGNEPGTGALVTFKDSNWLMSVVLAKQPHFVGQPSDVQVFWGYGLFPDRVGNFVGKPMVECTGEEILVELAGHLGFHTAEVFGDCRCIPCYLPFITAQFLTRKPGDRPPPVPRRSKNLGFIGQFVEIPDDVVFTVEYSVRVAQMAVYQLLGVKKPIPKVTRYDRNLQVLWRALKTAFRK